SPLCTVVPSAVWSSPHPAYWCPVPSATNVIRLWQFASVRFPVSELSALPLHVWSAGRYWPSLTSNAACAARTAATESMTTRNRMVGSPSRWMFGAPDVAGSEAHETIPLEEENGCSD